ncbi:MAG: hypothetical protein ABR922_14335 [Streptosporangiaceae bacterium]|jgi:hypothetical protein
MVQRPVTLADIVRGHVSWMSRIPLPLTDADRDHGCWWQLAMRQVEVCRTLVFDDPRRVRTVFEELLAGNINLGRLERAEVIFGSKVTRGTPGHLLHRLLNRGDQVTVNLSFKHSRIKIYLKEDHALRVETIINDPGDLGSKRKWGHSRLLPLAACISAGRSAFSGPCRWQFPNGSNGGGSPPARLRACAGGP